MPHGTAPDRLAGIGHYELEHKIRKLEVGLGLPGWTCPDREKCGVFNGAAKEWLQHCRCCGMARPTLYELHESLTSKFDVEDPPKAIK